MFRTFLKKATAFALAAMMAVSVIGMSSIDAEAASKKAYQNLFKQKSVSVKVGKTYDLDVTKAKPNYKKYRTVKWTSSNKAIATVSSKGKVKGIKPGKVTITATSTKNTKVKAKCTVTVYKNGYIARKPQVKGGMYVYSMPDNSNNYRFVGKNKDYKVTDASIKEFMTLFGKSKNSLINKWTNKKSIKLVTSDFTVTVTGKKTDRTLTIKGSKFEGKYVARLYKNKEKHDYMFAVKGVKTNNKWQKFYVDSSKNYYTFTADNKLGIPYTYKVRKDGKAAYLKAGRTYLYKYEQTSKYDVISINKTMADNDGLKAYYWGKKQNKCLKDD